MNQGQTLIDLIARYPRAAAGIAAMMVAGAISGKPEIGLFFGIFAFAAMKKGALDWLRSDQSGYLDRDAQGYDPTDLGPSSADRLESLPRYSSVTAASLDAEDAAEEAWVAPPEPAAPAVSEIRREASNVRYGIAVPPKKPVDVPRR
jgi:hypothetical protein